MSRSRIFARSTVSLVLALGLSASALLAPALAKDKPAEAPKLAPSKGFVPVYMDAKTAIDAAGKRADVVEARAKVAASENTFRTAQGKQARAQGKLDYDAALAALGTLLQPERERVDKAYATAANADDRFIAGQLALTLGNLALDKVVQRRGLQTLIESGKLASADMGKYQFYIGGLSFDLKDYATARTAFQEAMAKGFTSDGVEVLLADAYINDNQPAEGLKVLQSAIDKQGAAAPADWLRHGVAIAFRAKLNEPATSMAAQLVNFYPEKENWSLSLAVVRDMNKYSGQDQIDLLRLMERTKSFAESRDYIEYIQAADPRRLPGEALKIITQGVASGMLSLNDMSVSDAKTQAMGRIAADKASLPLLEKDARAAGSGAATVMAAGDAYLSYDQPAKAEEFYTMALTRPGIDSNRAALRLGIAQADQGKYDAAIASFAQVSDARAPIAKLWSAYVKGKKGTAPVQ